MDIKERYKEFTNPSYFSRVDNSHLLEIYLGLDDVGRKAIEFRGKFTPRKVTGTTAIEVNQYKRPEYNTIRFSLSKEDYSGLFYTFVNDLVTQTRSVSESLEGYQAVTRRYYQWKKMFKSSRLDLLTEPEIMGLIGEILFLKGTLASIIGLSKALYSWSGQELTHKDFSCGDSWYEVKTIARSHTSVKISSLEQLDSPHPGELVVFGLEKMSEQYNGITLNQLIIDTRDLFQQESDQDKFMSKVALQGYEYNDYYDNFFYECSSFFRYSVDGNFPKLCRANIPAAICKTTYDLSLVELAPFQI